MLIYFLTKLFMSKIEDNKIEPIFSTITWHGMQNTFDSGFAKLGVSIYLYT